MFPQETGRWFYHYMVQPSELDIFKKEKSVAGPEIFWDGSLFHIHLWQSYIMTMPYLELLKINDFYNPFKTIAICTFKVFKQWREENS